MKTIEDYLPKAGFVRVRIKNGTYLIPVSALPAVAARNPGKKISTSYARYRGGQCYDHVREVVSVCIDLDCKDGFASREQLDAIRRRFPRAAVVWSHGFTMIYLLPDGLTWESSLNFAVPIGVEAEAFSGLTYDVGTHLAPTTMLPARHRGHLFRYPGGWASRRGATPEFFPPLIDDGGGLVKDSEGINRPWPTRRGKPLRQRKPSGSAETPEDSEVGSLLLPRQQCSDCLRLRRANFPVTEIARRVGVTVAAVEKLFARPRFAIRDRHPDAAPRCEFPWGEDEEVVGVIGLDSASRSIQETFNVSANFAHSLQAYWDLGLSPDSALPDVLSLDEFLPFRLWFEVKFGSRARGAIKADVERCYRKFGLREGLKLVSRFCKRRIMEAVIQGPCSGPALARRAHFSLAQTKRALEELKAEGMVQITGRNKGAKWNAGRLADIDSYKIELTRDEEERGVSLQSPAGVTSSFGDSLLPKHYHRPKRWLIRKGTKRVKHKGGVKAKALVAKLKVLVTSERREEKIRQEITTLSLPQECATWWLRRPKEWSKLKSRFAHREIQRRVSGAETSDFLAIIKSVSHGVDYSRAMKHRSDRLAQFAEKVWGWETKSGNRRPGGIEVTAGMVLDFEGEKNPNPF